MVALQARRLTRIEAADAWSVKRTAAKVAVSSLSDGRCPTAVLLE